MYRHLLLRWSTTPTHPGRDGRPGSFPTCYPYWYTASLPTSNTCRLVQRLIPAGSAAKGVSGRGDRSSLDVPRPLHTLALVYSCANRGALKGMTGQSLAKRLLAMRTVSDVTGFAIGPWRVLARAALVYAEFACTVLCGLGLILWSWPFWEPQTHALLSDMTLRVVVERTSMRPTDEGEHPPIS